MNWINIYYVLHMFQKKLHVFHMQSYMQSHMQSHMQSQFQNNTLQMENLNGFDINTLYLLMF